MKQLTAITLLFHLFFIHVHAQTTTDSPLHIGVEAGWFWNTGNVKIESADGFFLKNTDLLDYRRTYAGINFSYRKPRYALELSISGLSNVITTSYESGQGAVGSASTYLYIPVRYYRHLNLGAKASIDLGLGFGLALLAGGSFIPEYSFISITEVNGVVRQVRTDVTETVLNRYVLCTEPTLRIRFKTGKNHELSFLGRHIYSFSNTRRENYQISINNQPPQFGSSRTSLNGFVLGASFLWHFKPRKDEWK